MTEPTCCNEPMVHNSRTGEYECSAAYFGLLDDGLLSDVGGFALAVDVESLDQDSRKLYEHWLESRRPDGSDDG